MSHSVRVSAVRISLTLMMAESVSAEAVVPPDAIVIPFDERFDTGSGTNPSLIPHNFPFDVAGDSGDKMLHIFFDLPGNPPYIEHFGTSCVSGGPSATFRLVPAHPAMLGGHGHLWLTLPVVRGYPRREVFFGGLSDRRHGPLNLPFPLDALWAPGCTLYTSLEWQWPTIDDFSRVSTFWASADLSLPNDPRLLGVEIYSQAVQFDPTANGFGAIFSNGARTRVIPKTYSRLLHANWRTTGASGSGYEGMQYGGPRILFSAY